MHNITVDLESAKWAQRVRIFGGDLWSDVDRNYGIVFVVQPWDYQKDQYDLRIMINPFKQGKSVTIGSFNTASLSSLKMFLKQVSVTASNLLRPGGYKPEQILAAIFNELLNLDIFIEDDQVKFKTWLHTMESYASRTLELEWQVPLSEFKGIFKTDQVGSVVAAA